MFTHGGNGSPDAARRIDYGGVAAVLHALDGRTPRLALMTSIGVSRRGAYGGSTGQLLDWKLAPSDSSAPAAPLHDRPARLVRRRRRR